MNIENLTFDEYLSADAAAARSEEGKLAFERLLVALEKAPKTRERLAFEMVRSGLNYLKQGAELGLLSSWIRRWAKYVGTHEIPRFMGLVEDLTVEYFASFDSFQIRTPELTLPILLSTIEENQPARLDALLRRLKARPISSTDIRRRILQEFEEQRPGDKSE